MMNQDNPYAMNQTCKVCGEPAAGFHFGAFTCEGCKSFFGRSYNNLSSISDCKNNGECIINKKNRTACKACRLRKCLLVGMSKSGSRYGRRSNWFKIHCLLQEQQQQAAAAMAAHHNNQQHAAAAACAAAAAAAQHGGSPLMSGHKPPPPHGMSPHGPPGSAAAAAALGMLGHAGAYPGLYPPRTKEELLMLGLEEYAAAAAAAKHHPANASPSVSSPDSHNSDNSLDVNTRGNSMLHLSGKHGGGEAGGGSGGGPTHGPQPPPPPPQHLRKDLPHFLPLPFGGLGSMPVMPPPPFLPPSHLLFPGYHPALYSHHQGLLKTSAEQQQQAAAAAAAVQQLFNPNNGTPNRFSAAALQAPNSPLASAPDSNKFDACKDSERIAQSPKSGDTLNNNHIPNGSRAAEELTKRFYLDAVLKSQRNSPPPATTKLPKHPKHDYSISALVTPNSESGRERLRSHQSNEDEEDAEQRDNGTRRTANASSTASATRADIDNSNGGGSHADNERAVKEHHEANEEDDEEEEELVVSMTPPHSPVSARAQSVEAQNVTTATAATTPTNTLTPAVTPAAKVTTKTALQQDNPIDLSMKTNSSVASSSTSLSSKCSSNGSDGQATDSDNEIDCVAETANDERGRISGDDACDRRQKIALAPVEADEELLQVDVNVDELDSENDAMALKKNNSNNKNDSSNNNKNNSNSNNNNNNSNNNGRSRSNSNRNNNNNNSNNNSTNSICNSSDSEENVLKLDVLKRKQSVGADNAPLSAKRLKLPTSTVPECASSDKLVTDDGNCVIPASKIIASTATSVAVVALPTTTATTTTTTTPLDLTRKV